MSSLLRDAIVDAKALREAALKNAEAVVIDKYSSEVKQTLENLLEQEAEADLGMPDLGGGAPAAAGAPLAPDPLGDAMAPPDLGAIPPGLPGEPPIPGDTPDIEITDSDIPLAATDNLSENEGEDLDNIPKAGEEVNVEINLDALQEAVTELTKDQEIELNEADLRALLDEDDDEDEEEDEDEPEAESTEYGDSGASQTAAGAAATSAAGAQDRESGYGGTNEELEITDELIDDIVERLTVDMGATLAGWAGRSSEDMKYELERALAHRRSTDFQDDFENLKKAHEELVFENKQLSESLKKYEQATHELRQGVHEVNLSNARLLYTNRVLRNTSLNERQKTKIADAISKAGSVTEAKTIYHTLESTVESTPNRGPQSLSEAIGRPRTSVLRASRKESTSSDPLADRMKRLAGIK
tara:strand:+ start:4557 stop:5798 length:1242 start_codon:yes stop_codon:yes gene_type:complete